VTCLNGVDNACRVPLKHSLMSLFALMADDQEGLRANMSWLTALKV